MLNRAAVEKAVFEREAKLSTALEGGLALPHARTDEVKSLLVAVGVKAEGVDFDAPDDEPARIIVLAISPATQPGPHIQLLAQVVKLLAKEEVKQRLLRAKSGYEVVDILTRN